MKVNPIFTLGAARNGTTFLANRLINLAEVFGAHHVLHHGSYEQKLLANFKYWGDLSEPNDYLRFLHQFQIDDGFILSGLDISEFYGLRVKDFFEFYFELSDRAAQKTGKPYWTTKLDTLLYTDLKATSYFLELVLDRYDNPKFIGVKRDLEACILSYLNMEGRRFAARQSWYLKDPAIVIGVARYFAQYVWIERILKDQEGILLRFEELVAEGNPCDKVIDAYLETGVGNEATQKNIYQRNTSFLRDPSNKKGISRWSYRMARFGFSTFPFLGRWFCWVYERLKSSSYPVNTRLFKYKYYPDLLKAELKKRNAVALIKLLDIEESQLKNDQ
ncbi:MAG: sulfotransferase [Bacteroidota bacterium]